MYISPFADEIRETFPVREIDVLDRHVAKLIFSDISALILICTVSVDESSVFFMYEHTCNFALSIPESATVPAIRACGVGVHVHVTAFDISDEGRELCSPVSSCN